MKLESLLQYVDQYLAVAEHPDYPTALNGLQVGGPDDVERVATAVDTSLETIEGAAEADADLLIVHHGLFWDGLRPLTGRRFRRVRTLIGAGMGLYACHLPLDSHAEVGNCALLGRALGLELRGRFGPYKGTEIGWWGSLESPVSIRSLEERFGEVVGGPVHTIPGGRERVERVGVVTGAGASFLEHAAAMGLDALVTGEGAHHHHIEAMELGIHLLFGGHYATETFGVRALGEHLAERFGVEAVFIDRPTGL